MNTSREAELLPCPFCGGEPQLERSGPNAFVFCPGCSAENTVKAWNTRALTSRIVSSGVEDGEVGRVPSAPGCEPTASAAQGGVFAKSHPSREVLEECREYFDGRADAECFPDSPSYHGNEEMKLLVMIDDVLRRMK